MRLIQYTPRLQRNPLFVRNPLLDLERELDRMFDTVLSGVPMSSPAEGPSGAQIRADIYEDKDNFYVRAEIPGAKREDIHVEVAEGFLSISGARKFFDGDGREQESSSFERRLSLPTQTQEDRVTAAYENGVLTVTLPKREESKPRKIAVEVK